MPYPTRTSGVRLFACAPPDHADATRAILTHQPGVRARHLLTPADRGPGAARRAGPLPRPEVLVHWPGSAGEDVARPALAQRFATACAAYAGSNALPGSECSPAVPRRSPEQWAAWPPGSRSGLVGVRRRSRRSSSPCSTVCNSAILTIVPALSTGSTTACPGTGCSAVFSAGIVAFWLHCRRGREVSCAWTLWLGYLQRALPQ